MRLDPGNLIFSPFSQFSSLLPSKTFTQWPLELQTAGFFFYGSETPLYLKTWPLPPPSCYVLLISPLVSSLSIYFNIMCLCVRRCMCTWPRCVLCVWQTAGGMHCTYAALHKCSNSFTCAVCFCDITWFYFPKKCIQTSWYLQEFKCDFS